METMAPAPVVDRLQQSGFSQLCTDLFRANPTPSLLVSGVEGLVVLANPALEQYTGYKADSLIGKAIAELPFCCDCEQGSDLGRLTADPASLDGYQCRLRHCEGHNLPVLISTRRLEHEGVPHLLISFTDITDLKLTEEQLRQSERFYRDLYEGSRDGYALCDLSGRIIECNESFAEILGSTPDDCRGLHYVQITPAKWHAAEERILSEQLAESDSTEVFEKEYIKSDGTRVPVELRAHLRRDINGVPIGLWAFVRDVSQRKQIEKERHVNELKFRTLTEQALMAVIIYDEERVHYVNKTAAELLRVS
jgi:PAS domain S-box-containing protein